MAKDILKKDLYLILGVDENASGKEIVKGYRKKALKCHPDKNPDNPKAAEEFHELSQALEILTDAAARAAYDRSRQAKKEVEARNKVLDSKRKKFKEDLEAREQAAEKQSQKLSEADAQKKLQFEIERLRNEGSSLLEQEQSRLRDLLKSSGPGAKAKDVDHGEDVPRMKLKWKAAKGDANNGGYNEKIISDIFSCYGKINTLLISGKRNGSAIVEFESSGISSDVLNETGLESNPLLIVWLSGKPSEVPESLYNDNIDVNVMNSFDNIAKNDQSSSVNFTSLSDSDNIPETTFPCGNSNVEQGYSSDFESLVLRKMRQAEERKRLIEQMSKEDEDNG